ncbi:MAG: hypothetical protein HFJ75_08830 [Eggerthellaceae bacterium]|nr:hypothetical protein [Eggerthellaceae bacterium]
MAAFAEGRGKRVAGLALAAVVLLLAAALPGDASLSHQGILSLGVLAACVALWFCETLPVGVTGLVACVLLLVLGVAPSVSEAFAGYAQSTTWFNFGIFCLTALVATSSLGQRLVRALLSRAGLDSRRIVLAFMGASALTSMFMTDTGAAALVMSLALPVLTRMGAAPGRSNLGKALMLGISFASVLGGFTTPFGHTVNVLNVGLLEQYAGIEVTFFEWFGIAFPFSLVMLFVCWQGLIRAFPPEPVRIDAVEAAIGAPDESWTPRDRKTLLFLACVIFLFVVANWIPFVNTTVIILVALAVLFLPGMDLLDWDEFSLYEGWNVVLMVGGILSLGQAITASGAGDWLAERFLESGIMDMHVLVALLVLTGVVYLIHTFCPIAPALCTLLLPPMVIYANSVGISPIVIALILSAVTAGNFLVPLNPNMMVTFTQGYYRFGEVARGGWLSAIVFVVLLAVWCYFAGALLPVS